MKKTIRWSMLAAGLLLLTGCVAETYPLTEEEQDIIAEYAAGALLRSDENYTEALLSPTPTPTPVPTLTPIPTPIPDSSVSGNGSGSNKGTDSAQVQPNTDLNQVFGLAELKVMYDGYEVQDTYSQKENDSLVLRAEAGKRLLVVNLVLENTAGIAQNFEFGSQGMVYQLDCNEKSFLRPELTVLENDLLYMKTELAAGEKKASVLVFQINADADLSDANLIVSRGNYTAIVSLY